MNKEMKKLMIIAAAVVMCGCGIYKPYTRPETPTDDLYGRGVETSQNNMADMEWRQLFTDPALQILIEQALENNTDMQSAYWRLEEASAALKTARLSYLPSFNLAPQGGASSFDKSDFTWTWSAPVTASWQIDLFNGITNRKRRAKAVYAQSAEYRQAVRAQLIAGVANLYYTLVMLDSQYAITQQTVQKWNKSIETMRAMKEAGMTNEVGIQQYTANALAVESSTHDLEYSIRQVENSLCSLLGEAPRTIARGTFADAALPSNLAVGVPVELLANRPDVRSAEAALMQAYYATAAARSALYPSITLSGSAGWTNNAGMIVNPGKLLLSAAGSLVQPIFNAGAARSQVKISRAQQQEAALAFRQTLLNAGAEVNNALAECQTAEQKRDLRVRQIAALERAVEGSWLLMRNTSTTYLDVLTAEQSLLSAQLSQATDSYDEWKAVINLYQALGGGRDKALDEATQKKLHTRK